MIRLNKVTRDLNVGIATVVDFLQKKGYTVEANPNTKITDEQYAVLVKEFSKDKDLKIESEKFIQERQNKDRNKASVSIDDIQPKNGKNEVISTVVPEEIRPKVKTVGRIDLDEIGRKQAKAVPADKAQTADIFRKWKRMEKGSPIEDYTFKDMQDKEVRLSDFQGKYIFIDCWATWCGPCRAQVAPLRQVEEDYKGKNIVFIGVSSDSDRDKWKAFVKEQKLPGIQVNISANHPFYEHFAVSGIQARGDGEKLTNF